MERLIAGTSAYKIVAGDAAEGRLSHAYMLLFADPYCLRDALKIVALRAYGADAESRDGRLLFGESLSDVKIYPPADGKLTAAIAAEICESAQKRGVEGDRKLYLISDFQNASPIFQNKLLKILEEPPEGVYFILGATALAPVLPTVRSRVKLLEIPPFTESEIFAALKREGASGDLASAAKSCGGVLGVARNILRGQWYSEVRDAAEKLCSVKSVGEATAAAIKYAEFKYKKELLTEMQRIWFERIENGAIRGGDNEKYPIGAAIYAVEQINEAFADMRFNANFASLLYDLTLRIAGVVEKTAKE